MKVKGTVKETIILEKVVEIDIPEGTADHEAYNLITEEAYKQNIMQFVGEHGWVGKKTVNVDVDIKKQ
jgi:putative IMPACT (imprinted ancient) family translation regulator